MKPNRPRLGDRRRGGGAVWRGRADREALRPGRRPVRDRRAALRGATIGGGLPRRREEEASVRGAHAPRLALVALFGAALTSAALAWRLQHAGALAASLLLNVEAVFTVVLARAFYREPVGGRVIAASTLMVAGGALLAMRGAGGASGGTGSLLALAAVAAATFRWALDNTLTRPLADLDPHAVVF